MSVADFVGRLFDGHGVSFVEVLVVQGFGPVRRVNSEVLDVRRKVGEGGSLLGKLGALAGQDDAVGS